MRALKLLLAASGLACAAAASAQNYEIAWWTVDGGGGSSPGGPYAVTGTIGQPNAGRMSGCNYALEGGFRGVLAVVQTPGAPHLSIGRSNAANVVLSWPAPSTGFKLQENPVLSTTDWGDVATAPVVVRGEKRVIASPPAGNRLYRLLSP